MTDLRGAMLVVAALLAGCSGRSAGSRREPAAGAPAVAGVGGGSGNAGSASGAGGSAGTAGTSSGRGGAGTAGGISGGGEGGDPSGGTAGSGSGGRSGGAGGSSGGGSSGGGSSGGGSSGNPAGGGPADFPPECVRTLTASCPLEGACTFAETSTMEVARACYASGTVVTYDYSNEGLCTPGHEITAHVYASDGSLCYTTVRIIGAGCESSSTSWLDAEGNAVATESTPYPGNRTTLTCEGGDSASCSAPCEVLNPACQVGDCPSP